jgi:hypothetical protein
VSISFARNQFPPAIIRHVRARREVRSAAFVKVQGEGMRIAAAAIGLSRQPKYGCLAHVESTSQIGLRNATFSQRGQGLPLLVLRQLRWSAHVNAASASSLPSIAGPGANKLALKFREPAQYR